jgi:stage V sporulation protein G
MEITDVRIRRLNLDSKMKAVASVTFDNCFVAHDIKIIESNGKTFIAMPSRKTPDGEYKDIVHPINSEFRKYIDDIIIERYNSL